MKVLLLGPNGQLGTDLQQLHAGGEARFELAPVPRTQLDVADAARIAATLEELSFDALINCTSYHKTDEAEKNGTLAMAVNAHAVRALAELCARKRARLVHISTDYVFGGDRGRTAPLVESDSMAPVNVYGASKAMGETLALLASESVIVVRVASLFGVAGASGKGGNFVETMIRIAREKGTVQVVGDTRMSPTATADVARWIVALLEREAPAGVYHGVNSGDASWFEFTCAILDQTGVPAKRDPLPSSAFPTVAMRPTYSVLDNSKLAAVVGPIPHWRDALGRYLRAKGHRA